MRKASIATALVFAALSTSAFAADLPNIKGPPAYVPPLAPVFSWTGCYIGVNAGGAWANQSANTNDPVINAFVNQAPDYVGVKGSSFIGGGQAGCNYEFPGTGFVVGVEGDFSGTNLSNTVTGPNDFLGGGPVGTGFVQFSRDVHWLASIRGRIGYAIIPTVMIYATGGGAISRASYTGFDVFDACPNCGSTSFSSTPAGWVAGGGIEWAFTNNWLLRGEFLHYSLAGSSSVAFFPGSNDPAANFHYNKLNINEARVGISYKFDWFAPPAPVVAKY